MSPSPFLFATSIANSSPTIAGGARVDQMEESGHHARWEEDFALVRECGLNALRYGPAYYRTHIAPDAFDWDQADEQMARLATLGINVIADLCNFGVPTWLGGFQDPAFPVLFAEYARAFARRYPQVRHYTPVNAIFTCASQSALHGVWNECEASEPAFVRAIRNLCMAHELAVEAILADRPDAIIVQCESIEHFHAAGDGARAEAARWNEFKQLALDLTTGHELAPGMARFLNGNGVPSNELSFFREKRALGQRWLGVSYYPAGERRVASTGRQSGCRNPMGFKRLATQYHQRYRLPVFHAGTNRPTNLAVGWLDSQWSDVVAMRASGIPVMGFTWHSLTDHADSARARSGESTVLHPVGLYDRDRQVRPVGTRYRQVVRQWRGVLGSDARTSAAELVAAGVGA